MTDETKKEPVSGFVKKQPISSEFSKKEDKPVTDYSAKKPDLTKKNPVLPKAKPAPKSQDVVEAKTKAKPAPTGKQATWAEIINFQRGKKPDGSKVGK